MGSYRRKYANLGVYNYYQLQSDSKDKSSKSGKIRDPQALIEVCQDKKLAYEKGGELGRDVDVLSIMDVAMASQNIMLQAYDEKIGSCPECFLPFGLL